MINNKMLLKLKINKSTQLNYAGYLENNEGMISYKTNHQ